MPPTKTWKNRERSVAKWFGASGRTPLSGGNSGHTRSDTLHESLFIEHKHRRRWSLVTLWNKVFRLARLEDKIPVITISEHGQPGFWVFCHSSDLTAIANQRILTKKEKS